MTETRCSLLLSEEQKDADVSFFPTGVKQNDIIFFSKRVEESQRKPNRVEKSRREENNVDQWRSILLTLFPPHLYSLSFALVDNIFSACKDSVHILRPTNEDKHHTNAYGDTDEISEPRVEM